MTFEGLTKTPISAGAPTTRAIAAGIAISATRTADASSPPRKAAHVISDRTPIHHRSSSVATFAIAARRPTPRSCHPGSGSELIVHWKAPLPHEAERQLLHRTPRV